jgi:hypothetical protein
MKSPSYSVNVFFCVLLLTFLVPYRVAKAQSVQTFVIPDTVAIGDTFSFVISTQYPVNRYQATYPDSTNFGDGFELRSVQRFRGINSRDSVVYRLQFFSLQDTVIGAKPVYFSDGSQTFSVNTAPVPIFFRSSLDSVADELRPIKPLFSFAISLWPWLLLGIIIGTGFYLIWRYRHRLFGKKTQEISTELVKETPLFISPLRRLSEHLRRLDNVNNFHKDGFKELYFELSIAFRTYFEEVYMILALESTTREVLRDLEQRGMIPEQLTIVKAILRESDMVKFARVEPNEDQAVESLRRCEELVQQFRKTDQQRISMLRHDFEVKYGLRSVDSTGPDKRKAVMNPMVISDKEDS